MTPLLTIALSLLSNAADLARFFVAPTPAAITFTFQNRHETASFAVLDTEGHVKPDVMKELSHFLRCWRTQRERPMHPRLIEMVAAISRQFGDAEIEVISG